jgi:hypothetical protein
MKSSELDEDAGEDGDYVIVLKDGTPFDEVISGLQKSVRRGLEREALVFALALFNSGFGKALARRLALIAAEDVGLAAPDVVAQVCTLSTTWLLLKKESSKNQPESLPLMMAVMLMCRSPKNREVDDACVIIQETLHRGIGIAASTIIRDKEDLIVDSHTRRGKERLRKTAQERGVPQLQLAWEEFYENGAILRPLKQINGNSWGHEAYKLFGLNYDEVTGRNGD